MAAMSFISHSLSPMSELWGMMDKCDFKMSTNPLGSSLSGSSDYFPPVSQDYSVLCIDIGETCHCTDYWPLS